MSAQINIYHPFPESGGVWNQHLEYYCFSGGYDNEYYSYVMAGDSAVGPYVYHKIIIGSVVSAFDTNCFSYPPNPPVGFIRQDPAMKTVYLLNTWDTAFSESILYNFNMAIGDSVIDSVLIGNNYRKRWNITGCINGCSAFIIEGIGSSSGVIRSACNFCQPHSPYYTLNCYTENGVVLYTDGTTQCQFIDNVNHETSAALKTDLFPNPFHSSARLEIKNQELGNRNYNFKIYNAIGLLVREEQILHLNSYILHRGNLSDGLYFYELRTSNYEPVCNGKFVIE